MQKEVQDIDFINSIFTYNPCSGELIWRERVNVPAWWNTRYAGKKPSNCDKLGYMRAKITRGSFSGYVSVHRICFFMYHGWLPDVVDHIDGNVKNNKITNLRPATWKTNTWNHRANTGTETGYKGVKVVRKNGKINGYTAMIGHNGVREYLGFYKTAEEARDAYLKRELELRPDWVRVNE